MYGVQSRHYTADDMSSPFELSSPLTRVLDTTDLEDPTLRSMAIGTSDQLSSNQNEKQTAKLGVEILVGKGVGFVEPSKLQRIALSVSFAKQGRALYGKAYDLVRVAPPYTLDDILSDDQLLSYLQVCEVKSTKQSNIPADFKGYFFDLTTAELLVAQTLGTQFIFVFVNTVTGDYLELTLSQLYGRTRNIYPKWAVQF